MKHGHFKVTASQPVYQNSWISVHEDKVVRPGGASGVFGIVTMQPGSSVVALDTASQIFLVREFKYAVGRETLEVISGGIDSGESPLDAAKRELKEESGLSSDHWTNLGTLDPFTSVINSPSHLFLAENVALGASHPEAGEIIELVKMPFAKAVQLAMTGEITHGGSVAAILKVHILLTARISS